MGRPSCATIIKHYDLKAMGLALNHLMMGRKLHHEIHDLVLNT
jgi:hypothetical protein